MIIFSIQLHLSGLLLPNIDSFLEIFGVDRFCPTVHNWVNKAYLKLGSGWSPNYVTVDETVIQLNYEQYWLYAVASSQSNDLLHANLEPTRTNVISDQFFAKFRENRREWCDSVRDSAVAL